MTTPLVTQLDYGLNSPPVRAAGNYERHRVSRATRRLFGIQTLNVGLRASPYAADDDDDESKSDDGWASKAVSPHTPLNVVDEVALERERLRFLMRENERLRTQLMNTALALGAQIEAWENRLLLFDIGEMSRRQELLRRHRRQQRDTSAPPSPLGTSPRQQQQQQLAAPAPPQSTTATESDSVYEF